MDRLNNIIPIIIIVMFELLILALLNLSVYIEGTEAFSTGNLTTFIFPMNLILFLLAIFSLIMFMQISVNIREEAENRARLENLKHLEALMQTMRRQRHEFNHHLQTVYGFLCVEAYAEVKEYLQGILEEVAVTNAIISVDNPGVSALLHVKTAQMELRNVQFEVINKASLKKLPVKTTELNEILANLLDNALEAVSGGSIKNPKVKLIIFLRKDEYIFSVINNGSPISQSIINKIIEPGFSTKKDHLGMGLHIVKQVVEKYGGTLNITSNELATSFEASIRVV